MKLLVCVTCLLSFVCLTFGAEPARFELRSIADAPGPNTEEAVLPVHPGDAPQKIVLEPAVLLDATALRAATVESGPGTTAGISLAFTDAGSKRFAEITTEHAGKRLAIILDGRVLAAPVVRLAILGGKTTITSSFTQEEAEEIVKRLNTVIAKPAS